MTVTTQKLKFHGTGGTLFGLVLLNSLLTVVTLGIYAFWAKTRVRQFMYSQTSLAGDRFAYHGTGKELLIGSLKATGVLVVLFLIVGVVFGILAPAEGEQPGLAQLLLPLLVWGVILTLLPIAINGARRYRLSRSSWRGIRFGFRGQWKPYLALLARGVFLSIVTLGIYAPYFQSQGRAFLVDNARYGTLAFSYEGDGKDLLWPYLRAVLLALPTLGLSWIWYAAFRHRYFWSHTSIGPARFQSTVTGGALLGLAVTNMLLVVFTLGIGTPWALVRMMDFFTGSLSLKGEVDWKTVQQEAQAAGATGEGLAEGLDVDVDVGLGM